MNLTPHLRGTLYLNNVAGLCARIELTYHSESNRYYTDFHDEYSGKACAPDNARYAATIDMAPYTSDQIASVEVNIETQRSDGSWQDVSGDVDGHAYIDYNPSL